MAKRIKLTSQLEKWYLDDKTADIHFECVSESGQPETIPGHKLVLMMASDVFKAKFCGPEKRFKRYQIVGVTAEAFKEFLQLFYVDHAKLSSKNALQVLNLVEKYEAKGHSSIFKALLKEEFTRQNIFWGYQLAVFIGQDDLKQYCEEEFIWNTDKVLKSNDILSCSRSTLRYILTQDRLTIDESSVFSACMAWANAACQRNGLNTDAGQHLRQHLGDLLYKIRFRSMTLNDFSTQSQLFGIKYTNDEYEELIQLFSSKEFIPKLFNGELRLKPLFTDNQKRFILILRYDPMFPSGIWKWSPVLRIEITKFTTNKSLLLGNLGFYGISPNKIASKMDSFCNSNVTIVEKVNMNSESPQINIIFNGSITLGSKMTRLQLPEAVFIKPDCMYEIHVELSSNSFGKMNRTVFDKVIQKKDIIIRFQDNGNGLVSMFCFNRLNI